MTIGETILLKHPLCLSDSLTAQFHQGFEQPIQIAFVVVAIHVLHSALDNRINSRVIKKKLSNLPKKRAEYHYVRGPQTSFERAASVLK